MSELHIAVLAAGQGKRMNSSLPKVLHPLLYRPMLHYVLERAERLAPKSVWVIVGHRADEVITQCAGFPKVEFVKQSVQKGTADAVGQLRPQLAKRSGTLLVLNGDVPLLSEATLKGLVEAHRDENSSATLLTTVIPHPTGYGRVLREPSGKFLSIREESDCSPDEKRIQEINCGVYCFQLPELFDALAQVKPSNAQNEFYLPDVLPVLIRSGKWVTTRSISDPAETLGINTRAALADVQKVLQHQVNHDWMEKGVSLMDPAATWIDTTSSIGKDSTIEAGCIVVRSHLGEGVTLEAGSRIVDSKIGNRARVLQGSYIEGSSVGDDASVGPYARLRKGTHLGESTKIGNFVELKNSSLGRQSKAAHLSYIGDAEIGDGVNLGCGFITCNYNGIKKEKTVIEDEVFVGSDSQTVAPVTLGKGSYVASGTTVTKDVPPGALVFSRGHQTTKAGYANRYRKGSK